MAHATVRPFKRGVPDAICHHRTASDPRTLAILKRIKSPLMPQHPSKGQAVAAPVRVAAVVGIELQPKYFIR